MNNTEQLHKAKLGIINESSIYMRIGGQVDSVKKYDDVMNFEGYH